MAQLTIRNHLGTLQEDPDNEAAFEGILDLLTREGADAQADENTRLLEAARAAHLTRGEPEAAARLLAIETDLVKGDPDREAKLWAELARIREEELLDDRGAREALAHVLTLRPGDIDAQETKEKLEATEANWKSITKRFLEEAEAASDNGLKTSLLVRVGGMVWQYKKKGRDAEVDETFKKALGADPGNVRAASLYERILRRREKWAELADVLLSAANATRSRDDRVNLLVRAGRVLGHRLKDGERAAGCFAQVIDFAPGHAEAMRFLVGHFTDREEWDHLVALYEDALKGRPRHDSEQGILVQIGMVHWRMRGDLDDAEPYFARLRKSDPAHGVMLNFYRELCERTNDSPKLLGVLSDAQRAVTEPADKQRLAIEIARVAQSTPATAERAIDAWKAVQRLDPENAEAPNALKALYRSAGKWNALVEVLKAEAETTHDPEKKLAVLRELVAIFRDRLQLDVMVINTYNAILQIEPRDPEALATLAKTYEAVGRWNDLIQVLARQAEAEEDGPHKVEILTRVAALWIERFANYNKATGPLEQVLSIDPHNRSALGLLKDIYTKRRSWQPLFEVLKKELDLVDGQTKRDLYVEMARIAAERLDKHGEAIELWRHALELDPTTPGALDAMERLAERQKDWPTLADILERRVAEAEDDKRRIELLQKLGQVAQDRLADPARAARAWRQILQIDPKNGRAMRVLRELYLAARDWESLELLYAEQNDWEGLVEVLGQAADKAEDPALKVQLSFRTAELYEKEIGEPHRAFRSYERVLGVEPGNERAIRALIPIYEKEQHGAKLPALYDALFGVVSKREGTTEEQLALLEKLRTVVLDQLSDAKRAMRYAGAAYELAPKDDAVRQSLERTADRANAWPDVSAAYELRMESSDDPEEVLALRRRVADIASDRLGSPEKAVEQLKAILAARPDDSDATTALDRIYRSTGRAADLRDLYAHRLARATDPADRYFLLSDLAKVEEDQLEDPDAASSRYRAILEIEPSDQDALAALERLSTTASRWTELRDVLAKRRELASGDERIELGFRLGQLYADKLADPKAALDEHAQVLAAKPGHPGAVAALERVLLHPELGLAAARMLEPELERAGNHAKLARTLEILLDSEESPDAKRSLRMRLADLRLHHLGDASGAFDVLASALRDAPGDEELWAQLGAAAGGAGTYAELAAAYTAALDSGSLSPDATTMLCARIAEIHEDHLASPKDAEPFHKRAIAIDPLAERPFLSLKRLYTDSERWEELQALYRNRIAQTVDAEAKLGLLMQVCFLFEEILDDPEAAIRAYQDVLEMAPDHEVSRRALERLFLRTERWRDLAALLTLELSTAQGNDLVELRYRLGELHESKLDDAAAAVDQYAEVLALSPRYLRAQEALERLLASASQRQRVASILEPLYESQGAWSELARVLEVQLEDVRDPGSRVGLLLRIAEIREQRLRDDGAAADAHGRAVLADPSDPRPRSELARIARAKGTERMRASILEQAIAATQTDPSLVAGLLRELAVLWDESVGDTTEAEKAYRRLLTVDGDNPESALPAARALERIYLGTGDNRALVETLRLQVRFEEDPDRRRRLRVRLADVLEQALGDVDGALAAHRDRLEAEPTDIDAMIALERLYEQKERYTDLIGVLRQRDAVTNDAATRLEIAQRIAGTYDEKLQSRDDAIVGYNEVLELARGQTGGVAEDARRKAIAALERLYADAGKWHDLVEVLELEHGLAHDSHDRAEVRFRIAETRRERIGDAAKAIEEYEEVLRHVHDHKGARAALELLLEDDNHRVAAARVIAPFYEVESNYAKLLSALDVVATHGEDPAERLDALKRGADVAEIGLNEPVRAFDLMARAVRLAAAEPDLRQLVDNLERLASAANRHGELMSLLREIAPDVLDGDLAVDLLGKVAHLARFKVGDLDLAREHYVRVLEQRPDDRRALDALEELYADANDHRALLDVLRKKADLASDPSARRRLLVAQAQLCEGPLADAPAAIVAYESVLEEGVDREAMLALERLYASSERWDDLANLLQRELDGNVGKPVDIRHRLGVVAIDHQSDTLRGIEHLRAALALDANHTESTAKLESLIEDPDYRAVVGETLEPIYLARMDWANVVRALEARISAESDTQAKKQLLVRLGGVKEEQLEDLDGALETYARLFREEITDTQVWDKLQRLTQVLTAWPRLADIFAGALEDVVSDEPTTAKLAVLTARICEEHTKDYERATKLYRRALAFDPRDTEAFTALERVHRVTESWEALLE
ncbi:MAG: hypothetical protein IT379_13555, partial [Deltaproteobacteria bacterium]|nr:hypothetical protein [Deltaproteobacteria bacterium]